MEHGRMIREDISDLCLDYLERALSRSPPRFLPVESLAKIVKVMLKEVKVYGGRETRY